MTRYTLDEIKRTEESGGAWWYELVLKPLVLRLVYLTANYTKLTPNQLTAVSFVFNLASAFCFLQGTWIYLIMGACLFEVGYIFDCIDGRIARLKGLKSLIGAYLDPIGNAVGQFLVVFCLIYGQYLVTKDVSYFLWGMPYIFLQTISYFNVLKLQKLEGDFYNQNQYKDLDNFVLADNFIQSKFPFAGKIKGHFHSKRLAPNPLTNIEAQTVALFICPMILQIKIGLLLASIISFGETLAFAVFYFLIKWRHKI